MAPTGDGSSESEEKAPLVAHASGRVARPPVMPWVVRLAVGAWSLAGTAVAIMLIADASKSAEDPLPLLCKPYG